MNNPMWNTHIPTFFSTLSDSVLRRSTDSSPSSFSPSDSKRRWRLLKTGHDKDSCCDDGRVGLTGAWTPALTSLMTCSCLTLAAVHLMTVEASKRLRSSGQADWSHGAPCQAAWTAGRCTKTSADQSMQGLHWQRGTGLNTSSLRCTWREVTSEACSPSLTASFMTGSPLVTLSGVALNNIRSMTDVLASSGDRLQLPSSLKMCIFSSNRLIICSSFLCRISGIRDKCKHTQHDTGLPAHYSTLTGTSAAHRGSPLLCSPGVSGLLPSHLGVPHPYLSPCQNTNEGLAWCSNTLQLLLSAQINVPHCSQRSNVHCWKQSSSNAFAR